ncbi:unnamed protein product [Caenorhabditis angaria]|uniref:Uncharacterized protein n=1 Tax=Caenorhabditis angaria TaxID=860376 RepID=A0A9P1MT53_9PELO|nr:unnamed protein product [Caenorhabditis angaria]
MADNRGKIAIVGSGLIGSSWATIFASAGYPVQLYDIKEEQLEIALKNVKLNLELLDNNNLRRGVGLPASEAISNITTTINLEEALKGAIYVQESALESLEFRLEFYKELDKFVEPNAILASSTSTIPASKFTENLKNRENCLIVHPVNPPLFCPLTELVPAPWTKQEIIDRAAEIMKSVGQQPVKLKKEAIGFVVNRVQFALLTEVYRLVADDVISVDDIDLVMTSGLGMRYAFHGPLETIHLNAFGVRDYLRRYREGIKKVVDDFGPTPEFNESDVIDKLEKALDAKMPTSDIRKFQADRESKLIELAKLKRQLEQ